jgi:hypothetical protein
MATAIVPLPLFECSTLQHVHLSSMHLCRCRYVSIACMAHPPPQFQSTHGRGRTQGTPLANIRHQQDTSGNHKTPAGCKRRDSGKQKTPENKQVHCTMQDTLERDQLTHAWTGDKRRMRSSSLLSAHPSDALHYQGYAMGDFAAFISKCAGCSSNAQQALQRQYTTQLNLGISLSSSSIMFKCGIQGCRTITDVGPRAFLSSCNTQETKRY